MASFLIALNAVFPFLFYLGFGFLTQKIGLVDESFLNKLNTVVFRCFFPFLMFWNLYNVEDGLQVDGRFLSITIGSLVLLIALLCLSVPRIVKERSRQSVIIQAIYRSNFVLFGIPMAGSLCGSKGAALATVTVAIAVPIYNAFAVILFEYYRGGDVKPLKLLRDIVTNPLILGAIVGLLFLLLGIRLPSALEKPVSEFSGLTTPLALFVLGGTLRFNSMKAHRRYLWPATAIKLLLLPLLATAISLAMHFSSAEMVVFLIMSGAPVAVSSFTMAANMGGDGELAGEFVFLSTVLSLFTLFGFIAAYHSLGYIV